MSHQSETPLVSIVLPTFNGARYLDESIRSCLDQTWTEIELVVVVDGSTDDSREVLARYEDPRLTVIDRTHNLGLSESLNEGFAASHGSLLSWTSDDNAFDPLAIQVMAEHLLDNPVVDFVYAGYDEIDADGSIVGRYDAGKPSDIWRSNVVGACFLFRRSVWEAVGLFNSSEHTIEDYEYWLRVSRDHRLSCLADTLYRYRSHTASLTGRLDVLERERHCARMKYRLGGISRWTMLSELARVDMANAFVHYGRGEWGDALRRAFCGVLGHPSFIVNRGVWAIVAKSAFAMVRRSGVRVDERC